jgi:catechol 2,3-dioxygenase-like lactoylglutathione lyase family enzyme
MINGGNATVFVSDMDRAVDFYVDVLGLTLRMRAENHWAEVVAGNELVIGLHPAGDGGVRPGAAGSIQIGLGVEGSIQDVVDTLQAKGVEFPGAVVDDGPVKLAYFKDPDGNQLYLVQSLHGGQ